MTINNIANGITNPHLNNAGIGGIVGPGNVQNIPGTGNNNNNNVSNNTRPPGSQAIDMRNFVSSIRASGNQMQDAASTLLSRNQSIWNNLQAASSNAATATARVSDQAQAAAEGAASGTMALEVRQLAASQQNTGNVLNSRAINNFARGAHQFSIERNGNTYDFSVNVGVTDSNQTIQQRMADAINRQNMGVTASVEVDSQAGTSTLVLTGAYSGEENNFTIYDRANSSLVSAMGLDNVTRQAQDALFTVNGEERRSAANDVNLGLGISATLIATSETNISVGRDTEGIGNVVNELVTSFNAMREAASRYADRDMGARTLLQRLDSIAAGAGGLSNLGITRGRDGQLQLDRDRLNTAINNGTAEAALANRQGFAGRLQQLGQLVENNPESFVSPHNRLHLDGTNPPGGGNSGEGDDDSTESIIQTQPGRNPINTRFDNRPRPSLDGQELFTNDLEQRMFAMMVSPQGMRLNMMGMLFSETI